MALRTAVSIEEYFEALTASPTKLEYRDGEITAMAGAKPAHNIISVNISAEFLACLRAKGCIVLSSDQLIRVEACDKYCFPDVVIVCEIPLYEMSSQRIEALLNPTIIVEVLSNSTESYDRTEKFDCYKSIPSFKEYVLISSTRKWVEVVRKISENQWLSQIFTEDEAAVIVDDCTIPLKNLYYGVSLP